MLCPGAKRTLRKAARTLPRSRRMPFHSGSSTSSKLSMPYGAAASASAATVRAVMVFTCKRSAAVRSHARVASLLPSRGPELQRKKMVCKS